MLAVALLVGCSRQNQPAFRRIAIIPFENLTGKAEHDWVSRGLAEIISCQLTGAAATHPFAAHALQEAPAARPTHLLYGYFWEGKRGLRVRAVLEDAVRLRAVRTASADGPVLEAADAIARMIEPQTRALPTDSADALRSWLDGRFEQAVAADPDFGPAYVTWAQSLAERGDTEAARRVAAAGLQRGARIGEPERGRLELLCATLDRDRAAQIQALEALARATPADAAVFARLGGLLVASRSFPRAVQAYQRALERDPDAPLLLNELGYALAYAGDLAGAVKTLERYRELRPHDANPSDSLGDVHFYHGRFIEAERHYLEAYRKSPAFLGGGDLYKAAWARLMTGDLKGADEHFAQFIEARRKEGDPAADFRLAQFEYLSGRRDQAIARLKSFAMKAGPKLAAAALAQLEVWKLERGEPADAAAAFAMVAPEEAAAYRLVLAGRFAEAAPLLRRIYERNLPGSWHPAQALLARALIESGQDPGALLRTFPIPDPRSDHPFACLAQKPGKYTPALISRGRDNRE